MFDSMLSLDSELGCSWHFVIVGQHFAADLVHEVSGRHLIRAGRSKSLCCLQEGSMLYVIYGSVAMLLCGSVAHSSSVLSEAKYRVGLTIKLTYFVDMLRSRSKSRSCPGQEPGPGAGTIHNPPVPVQVQPLEEQ